MKNLLFIALAILALTSCKKYVKCDNAELCIKNIGTDTIWCAWNSSAYTEKLLPGATICTNLGKLDTDPNNSQGSTTTFNSDHGSYSFNVSACHTDKEIK
jgi:hypothetical protein